MAGTPNMPDKPNDALPTAQAALKLTKYGLVLTIPKDRVFHRPLMYQRIRRCLIEQLHPHLN